MTHLPSAVLTIHLRLTGCRSLKEKRGRLLPLLHRLHREFNVSTAEVDLQDQWQEAVIVCGMVASDRIHLERSLQTVAGWVVAHWPDGEVLDQRIELV